MEAEEQSKPSFSPWRKWSIGFNVALIILVVFAVVVMVNYLSRDYSKRFSLSSRVRHELSPQSQTFLRSMTNRVKVILYYDRNEPFYSTVVSLLNEYKQANSRIAIEAVDYVRDAARAAQVKVEYKFVVPSATNLIIFDCEGHKPVVLDGNLLATYNVEAVEKERLFRKKAVEFNGEKFFTGALLAVTSAEVLNAYYLAGHGEYDLQSDEDLQGYSTFAAILMQNHLQPKRLRLEGSSPMATNCHLLIIAGPYGKYFPEEIEKIDRYLNQGGRLLVMFDYRSIGRETGLEQLLARWGVAVGQKAIIDPDETFSGKDIIVQIKSAHPLVNALQNMDLQLIKPRSVGKAAGSAGAAEGPQVDEVAFAGPHAFPEDDLRNKRAWPLIVAVEKGAIKGITERGATRIVVTGDAVFLTNHQIAVPAHVDFANSAINWLLARTQMFSGIGPRPVHEYRILMSGRQMQNAEWILVAGMPGAMLLLGGLVWLRRRQ